MGVEGLEFQVVPIEFNKGLETKAQKKLVIPGKWDVLDNVSLEADTTPRRRDGFTSLVASANGNGLATRNSELLVINGGAVSSVSTASTAATANAVTGFYGYVGVAKTEVRRSTGMQDSCDVAYGNGYTCYVWRDKTGGAVVNGVNCTLVDEATGAQLIANLALHVNAATFCPRVVFSFDSFFIFYIQGTSLFCRVILASAPKVVGAETALITSANLATLNFDVCSFGGTGIASAMVSYGWTDGTRSVRTIQVLRTGAIPSINNGPTDLFTEAQLPIATLSGLTCVAMSTTVGGTFAFSSGAAAMAGTAGATIGTGWGVTTAATQIINDPPPTAGNCAITAVSVGSGGAQLFTDRRSSWGPGATRVDPIRTVLINSTLGVTAGPGVVVNSASFAGGATDPAGPNGPWIAGKAFVSGSNVFLPVWVLENYQGLAATKVSNNQQSTIFIYDVTGAADATGAIVAKVVGKALYGAVGVAQINNNAPVVSTPCSVVSVSTGNFAYACTEKTILSTVNGFDVSSVGVVRLTLSPNTTTAPIKAQLGESTYLAGGSLTAYDGLSVAEHGFPLFPEGISLQLVAGGAMTAGVHQVVAIYEWVDNAGQRNQSAPSLPVSITTTGGNATITARVPSLLVSQKTNVAVVLYVTQAGGTIFNRVATTAAGSAGTANDTTAAIVTPANLTSADTVWASNELLYNQPLQAGTILPNLAPGPCSSIGTHQNRLWFDKSDQPGAYGFSEQYVNNVGLRFNDALGGAVDASGGGIVGWSELDEKIIILCARKLYAVYGTGPNVAGGFSNYSDPQEIPSDVGCAEARSILRIPKGIIFKSAKGWYLLGRDLSVNYVGAGVAAFDSANPTSAVLMGDRQECRFTAPISMPPGQGFQLIYNYDTDQWSTASSIAPCAMVDALYWTTTGRYVSVSLTSGLNTDTPGLFADSPSGFNQTITTTLRTSYLHLTPLEGFQRVRWLYLTGTSTQSPTSTFTIAVNYDDSQGSAVGAYSTAIALGAISFATGASVDLRHKLRRQKCKSVRFTFTESPAASDAPQLIGLQALALQVGFKKGTNKLPAAQSVG